MGGYNKKNRRTNFLQAFLKPTQPDYDHDDVDESEIPEDGNKVNIDLLVGLQDFNINSGRRKVSLSEELVFQDRWERWEETTDVFNPDSVDALAPKK